ncbi:hypothetical protein J4E90_003187 [Alternaria incomplexa]|uniref:uncharacterized protein n=1 Tax=Alternaria incomplexa TaxID=1187928 RepID=UPI00221F3723|nr:uncharacterized protein J4E90_003187 [Alternaria incomplexa]KAI4918798.1 hypothetical protein J4E90_003187 [Alternaria incomplexa]
MRSKELKRSLGDLNLLCSVILTACADIMDIAERARKQGRAGNTQSIWTEANTDIRAKHGFELTSVFDYSWIFANSLEEVLILGKAEPDAMGRARQILETYGVKQKGQDAEGIRDHLDEVLYVREAERPTPKIRGLIQIHQIPPVARLYILGQLEAKPTMAKPSTLFNHTVCLLREDITRLEVDIVVNSTDPSFSGMGTLDRSIFKKGGDELRSEVSTFGKCEEGDVKATAGYLLPAKHILHVVPPGVFRSDTKNILRNIYRAILHDAVLMRATSIAIPSIGTGMRNYPRRDCASLAMEEVKRFLESAEPGNGLDKIIFVVFSSNDEFVYKSLLPVYFPPTKGNNSPTILARQPAQVEESSSSVLPVPTNQPSLPVAGTEASPKVASAVNFAMTEPMGQAAASTEVRSGKQPVKSRAWNDDEAKTLMDFELHVGTCKACEGGLYERTHELCKPGFHFAEAVLQRTEMSEDALVYRKADEQGQREQLEMPVERLPSSMLLLSTVAKSGRYVLEDTFTQVKKPDTADSDAPVSEHPSIPNDPDNIAQATEQPAVVRVEVLSPHTETRGWFYSWVRVFRSKIEMYSGDYDPESGDATGHTPYASVDLKDTIANVDGRRDDIVSLWTAPRVPDRGETWNFRSSEADDLIALLELFKRAINRGSQEREKKVSAEVGEAATPQPTVAAKREQDIVEDLSADVNKPDAAKLNDQVQQSSSVMSGTLTTRSDAYVNTKDEKRSKYDKETHSPEVEGAVPIAPDTGPRAVIRVKARDPYEPHDWIDSILYVYESKIIVEFDKTHRPEQQYAKIDLLEANNIGLSRTGDGEERAYQPYPNMISLYVDRLGEREREPRDPWFFRTDRKPEADALFDVLQQAVDRNSYMGKGAASTGVNAVDKSDPMRPDDATSDNAGALHSSKAERNAAAKEAPAVLHVEVFPPRTSGEWMKSFLYVYKNKIDVYLEERSRHDSPYTTIDLPGATLRLDRSGEPGFNHLNVMTLHLERRNYKGIPLTDIWHFRIAEESDANAAWNVLQQAVNRNNQAQKETGLNEIEEATSPGSIIAPDAHADDSRRSPYYEDLSPQLHELLSNVEDRSQDKRYDVAGIDTQFMTIAEENLELETRILAYLNEDLKTRPGSYIGQHFRNIAVALMPVHPGYISRTLQDLAAKGKIHNTVNDETWVISEPSTVLRTSDQENQPEKQSETGIDALADQVLIYMDRVGGRPLLLHVVKEFQTSTDALWPAIRYLRANELISSQPSEQLWILTDKGRTRVRELRLQAAKSGQDIAQVPGSTPGARPSPSSYWSISELKDFEINVASFGTDWTAMANHMGTKTPTMLKNNYLRLVEIGNPELEQLAQEADARNALASQRLAAASLTSMEQPTSDEGNAIAEKRGDSKAQPETDANQDYDQSNSLADRALSYLRSLSGVSENISDLATTFDTPVDELQPVLKQLRSDGLVHNTGDNSTWAAAISTRHFRPRSTRMDPPSHSPIAKSDVLPRSGGGYNKYPCPNWQKHGHPSNYNFVDRKDELCAHCMNSWRDGRGTKERRQTRFSRAMTDDIEEDVASGTASSLRQTKIARERKHNASSKAKKDDIDDELEDYDGQEEDFV